MTQPNAIPESTPPVVPAASIQTSEEACEKIVAGKTRRSSALLASLGLVGVTGGAVFALGYDAVVNGNSSSIAQLATTATLGMGGLLALAGVRDKDTK